jgi:hypothetical protein
MTIGDLPRVAAARSRRVANQLLGRLDTRRAVEGPLPQTPILILGAPRSGSTLLYQAMVERFDVAYLSNRHCRWNGSPALVERRFRPARHAATYRSRHGHEPGPGAPSECGPFWYRFFPATPHRVTLEVADEGSMARLRTSVARLGEAAGKPLVFKNLYCSLRVEPIARALPEAIFVVIERDLVDNARSLLAGRMKRSGTYTTWWSAEPPGIEHIRTLAPAEQVVEQIRAIERTLGEARQTVGPERFLDVRYEQLCEEPEAVMGAIARFSGAHGAPLATRGALPDSFERSSGSPIDPALEEALKLYAGRR